MNAGRIILLALFALASRAAEPPAKQPLLSPLFGDHAVLQRDRPVTVWGWCEPGATVTVTLGATGAAATTSATASRSTGP